MCLGNIAAFYCSFILMFCLRLQQQYSKIPVWVSEYFRQMVKCKKGDSFVLTDFFVSTSIHSHQQSKDCHQREKNQFFSVFRLKCICLLLVPVQIASLEDSLAHYFIDEEVKIKEKLLLNANKNLQEPVVTSQWSPMIKLDFSQKSILKDQSEYSSWLSRPRRRRKKNL